MQDASRFFTKKSLFSRKPARIIGGERRKLILKSKKGGIVMNKATMTAVGLVTGMVVGGTVGMIVGGKSETKRLLRKTTCAARHMGDMVQQKMKMH